MNSAVLNALRNRFESRVADGLEAPKLRRVYAIARYAPLLVLYFGCSEREPPAIASPKPHHVSAMPAPSVSAMPAPSVSAMPAPSVSATPAPSSSTMADDAPLFDAQNHPLPQTDTLPSFDSPSFRKRIDILFQAIVDDRPEAADAAFFPVVAYEQVKDVQKPARDHQFRLISAYHRNIHEYHRKVNRVKGPVRLLAVEPSAQPARWMKPGSEGNKLGYYRMLRSHLKYADANGREYRLEVTSLISWRGEWYVVHLDGFK